MRVDSFWRVIHSRPSLPVRLVISALVAVLAAWVVYSTYASHPKFTSDFGQWYLAAKVLLAGQDPYLTIGPRGLNEWPTLFVYPLPITFLAMPFVALSEQTAATVFVGITAFVFAFAITEPGLFLLPMVVSIPFQSTASLAQISFLITAAMFYPWLSWLAVAKPQAGLPIVAMVRSKVAFIVSAILALALVIVSVALLPQWIPEWLHIIMRDDRFRPPLFRLGGFLLPLALLRWRRRESWMFLTMAVLPQSLMFYAVLPLFAIPRNVAESLMLLIVSTAGIYLGATAMPDHLTGKDFYYWIGSVAVLAVYIPVLVLLLIRENRDENPRYIRFGNQMRKSPAG